MLCYFVLSKSHLHVFVVSVHLSQFGSSFSLKSLKLLSQFGTRAFFLRDTHLQRGDGRRYKMQEDNQTIKYCGFFLGGGLCAVRKT